MKKIFTLLFGLMLATQVWAQTNHSFDIGKLTFTVIDETNLYVEVSTRFSTNWEETLEIPSTATNSETGITYTVTQIAERGFYMQESKPKTVIIPNTVTTICEYAFSSCPMTSIIMSNNVTFIGDGAFRYTCFSSITLPQTLTSMGASVFYQNTNLESIIIPEGVTSIGKLAFSKCLSLSSVTIPNTVTSIGEQAFTQTKIKSIEIPGSVKSIGYDAFYSCGELESVTMHEGVEIIGNYAFEYCPKLRNVNLPQTITSIGKGAFSGYCTLKNFEIPASVTSIGEKAFESALHITYNGTLEGAPWGADYMNGFIDNDYIYTDESKTNLIAYLGDASTVVVPESVTTIGLLSFRSCSKLKRVYIPKSVTTMGADVFFDDSEDLTIYCEYAEEDKPTGWKSTWNSENYTVKWDQVLIKYAPTDDINGCYVATSATTLVSGIDVCAKNSKISLNAVPSKDYFFSSWNDGSTINLRSITVTESKEYIATFKPLVFEYNNLQYTVTDVEKHEVSVAMKKKPSGNFEIPSTVYDNDNDEYTVTTIENSAFNECTELTSVVIPNTVTSIGEKAFFKCSNLTSITLPEGLTTIQNRAFAQCTSLTLTLPHTVTEIGQGAFEMACTNQKELVIPQSVTDIGRNAFSTFGNNPDFFCEVSEQPSSWNTTWHTGFMGEVNGTAYFNCKQVTFGALTFITSGISFEEPKVFAKIQGDFESTDELPLQITELQATQTVKVTLYRTFTAGVSSTIMLPFEFSLDESFGKFYTVESVAPDDNGVWTALMSQPITGTLQPNTPYVFKPAKDITELTFEKVSLNPTSPGTNGTGDWKLHGVYEKTTLYGKNKINYGFAGIDAEGIQKGQFIRAGEGVWADPMRCYLTYKNGKEISKAATVLPDCIRVVFPDEVEESNNGEIITPISEIKNQTDVSVWSYNSTIYIESQPDTNYTIIDLNGRTLKTGVTHSTREEITLGRSTGIVIVNINGKSFKINY